jgi:hypothetical protein
MTTSCNNLLALTLFMLSILANYHDTAFALNNFAFFADGLNRRSYFHLKIPPFRSYIVKDIYLKQAFDNAIASITIFI